MGNKIGLQKALDKKRFTRIKRSISPNVDIINRGFVLGLSKEFVLLQLTENFDLLEFIIVLTKSVKSIRYNDNDAYYDYIMEMEGKKQNLSVPFNLNLGSFKEIVCTLMKEEKYIIVECEAKRRTFYIGEILKVKNRSLELLHFDAQGILDNNPTKIRFKDITKMTFRDRYIDTFRKYLRSSQT